MSRTPRDLVPYEDEPFDEPENPTPPTAISDRSRGVALALAGLLGLLGAHRFYAGKVGSGIGMLVTMGGLGFWWLYDVVLISTGEFRDVHDRLIRRWTTVPLPGVEREKQQRFEEYEEQLDAIRREVGELAERVDFTERLLAKNRDRERSG
jgi:TM2 domain-containing protein